MPKYPGLGLPLRHFPQGDYGTYPLGIHGNCYGGDSDLLPVREVAMMAIMAKLTDKPDWHKKVFDDGILAKWRKEALEYPDEALWKLATGGKVNNRWSQDQNEDQNDWTSNHVKPLQGIVSNQTFDYCVQELQNKARYYKKSGLIPTLDACAAVVKSDKLVSPNLQSELRKAFDELKADQKVSPDWHPNSSDMVQDLLHPSMYPLVYGRSKVLQEEVVGVNDAIDKWAGKGEVIEKDIYQPSQNDRFRYGVGSGKVPPNFWSDTYQWLPSNVAFQNDGTVKFTSYINNLHPNKYSQIYHTIEKLVSAALPAWDQCLALSVGYKKTEGVGSPGSRFSQPENPDDENPDNWDPPQIEQVFSQLAKHKCGTDMILNRHREPESSDPEASDEEIDLEEKSDESDDSEDTTNEKWEDIRRPVQPEPGPLVEVAEFYEPEESGRLSEKFKDTGLQIIVKMASIELAPEKPEFPAGGWHVEGQMNERICGTAIYYLDSENITSSDLSFRMQTSAYMHDEYKVGQDAFNWMERVYGTGLGGNSFPCLQNYGSVETKEGRLLAFPNVFQHRVSPFRLADPTKPGHRRFIVLWLIDPNIRIISTANVPPQQMHWWAESIFSGSAQSRAETMSKLPVELARLLQQKGVGIESSDNKLGVLSPELNEMLLEHFEGEGALPMSDAEAREHREKLMQARTAFHFEADDEWHKHHYSFCEH
ncbi:hypothetical protein LSUE1_G006514 [Lachnellula suecica]|uniref:Uncharacterized protein n=1 Tax=Lachnellula suecica TaxID=602035 RepID=A0A8T9C523_9HELO|nr:hypothetical protein LSUE1_G006514 [Lachnellula suecica]